MPDRVGPTRHAGPPEYAHLANTVRVADQVMKQKHTHFCFKNGRACTILPREDRRGAWEQDYEAMQAAMFFGPVPPFAEILGSVGEFENRFNKSAR